jgi:hypothetical protein
MTTTIFTLEWFDNMARAAGGRAIERDGKIVIINQDGEEVTPK